MTIRSEYANAKLWPADLTDDELVAEMRSALGPGTGNDVLAPVCAKMLTIELLARYELALATMTTVAQRIERVTATIAQLNREEEARQQVLASFIPNIPAGLAGHE